ncbi:MAG: T9SS C-terminal target domain-containing protein [Saprospirales bacterium]|nr:MAG: T9SS C-terminal target domain-containing protein [Saprospirales bacterium]
MNFFSLLQRFVIQLFLIPILLVGMSSIFFGQQTPETDVERLLQLAEEWNNQDREQLSEALTGRRAMNLPLRVETEDGSMSELMRMINGVPEYYTTNNVAAAISTGTNHVHTGGRTHLNLEGEGMIVGEWDAGAVLLEHQELIGRVLQKDGATSVHNHAVHVAGTLIASGVRFEARGMAPRAFLWAHDWTNDSGEMAQAAAEGLLISNHSYGSLAGWANGDWSGTQGAHWWGDISISEEEDWKFGFYDNRAAQWDQISYLAPYYLIVKSAGNNRNDNHSGPHFVWDPAIEEWVESSDFRQPDGGPNGYDCLPTYSNAKNILTVGAVNTVTGGYSQPSDVRMSNFSSWGPTNDGRIKPDLVGDGVSLFSSNGNGIASYNNSSGTSMSGPNVAGSLLLIQELHKKLHDEFMWSSSLKGLAIHTVDQAGISDGPDYSFGWGLLNTERAAEFLLNPVYHQMHQEVITSGDTLEFSIFGNGIDPVKTTLCWTDPAATPLAPSLNDPTLRLINDLDMRIIAISGSDSGMIYMPWILDPANPSAAATSGDNFRDNVEVVTAGILPQGEYIVRITHKGSELEEGQQRFSLMISAPPSDCSIDLSVVDFTNLSCENAMDGEVVLEASGGEPVYSYSKDGINFNSDSRITDLSSGLNYFYATDSNHCFGYISQAMSAPDPMSIEANDQLIVRINEPQEERVIYGFSNSFTGSNWGGDPTNGAITAQAVMVDDGSGNPALGCGDLLNTSELEGNIAIAIRGSCQFGQKGLRAQEAGAAALIIINDDGAPFNMAGGDFGNQVTIPVYMISTQNGQELIDHVNATDVVLTVGTINSMGMLSCNGAQDGILQPWVRGGNPPYSFEWNNGDTTEMISNLSAGIYELIVTDSRGCQDFISMVVEEPENLKVEFSEIIPESCLDLADGSAFAIGSGGTAPYQFEWSTGQQGALADNLWTGLHLLTVTDASGCTLVDSVLVPEPIPLAVETEVLNTCADLPNGVINLNPIGGKAPFEIDWPFKGVDGSQLDSIGEGTYTFRIIDACDNLFIDSIEIEILAPPSIQNVTTVSPICGDQETGWISVEVDGRLESIIWSNGEESLMLNDIGIGTYFLTLIDVCGTIVTDSIQLDGPEEIQIDIIDLQNISCPGEEDGAIAISTSGGTGALNLDWSTGNNTNSLEGLRAGSYVLIVTDSVGCFKREVFELQEPATLFADFDYLKNELSVQFINLADSNATFFWDFGDGNTSTEENPEHTYSESGIYEICLLVSNDCEEIEICIEVDVSPSTTVEMKNQPSFVLYPNPASQVINIEISNSFSQEPISVFNSIGQLINMIAFAEEISWDISQLPPGLYLIKMDNYTARFIKK